MPWRLRPRPAWIVLTAAFALPYSRVNAWNFIPATAVILLCARALAPRQALDFLGLEKLSAAWPAQRPRGAGPRRLWAGGAFLALGLLLAGLLHPWVMHLAASRGILFDPSGWGFWLRTRPLFQVLNEEWVLRGILPNALGVRDSRRPLLYCLALAAVFSALHQVLYPLKDGSWLGPAALFNLFLFGAWANAAWLRSGHIGWGFAAHLGWNLNRFTGDFLANGKVIAEGRLYNVLEGSASVAALLLVLTALEIWRASRTRS